MALIKIKGLWHAIFRSGKLSSITKHSNTSLDISRNPDWESLRRSHLRKQPRCQACGSVLHVEVHHIKPFHLFPEEEMNSQNLITLCDDPSGSFRCHLQIGHCGNFKNYNPYVVKDATDHYITILNNTVNGKH